MNELQQTLFEMYGELGLEAFDYVHDLAQRTTELNSEDCLRLAIGYCELAIAESEVAA